MMEVFVTKMRCALVQSAAILSFPRQSGGLNEFDFPEETVELVIALSHAPARRCISAGKILSAPDYEQSRQHGSGGS
jgi:hypothetical protein